MTDQKQNLHLSRLPLELAIIILENVPDFDSLFATIQTCRRLYQCFKSNAERIITSISFNIYQRAIQLDSQTEPFPYQGSCLIIQQLISAINNRYIRRDFVLHLFKNAWEFLFYEKLEELLIPLGKDLARSLELENRRQDAISLLQQIIRRQSPFKLSSTKIFYGPHPPREYVRRLLTFAPLKSLLLRFGDPEIPEEAVPLAKRYIDKEQKQLRHLPVALITSDGMLFFHDDEMLSLQSIIYIPPGICDESAIALIRLTSPPEASGILDRQSLEKVIGKKPRLWNILQELRSAQRQNEA